MTTPAQERRPSNWNLPNALTMARIVAVPVFAWALMQHHGDNRTWRVIAFLIFAAAMITDRYDGQIARARGIVTNFGKLADPIADKAIVGTAFVLLSHLGLLPWWMTITIIVREAAITILRFVIMRWGIMAASKGGKLKTAWQSLVIGLTVIPFELWFGDWVKTVYWVLMFIATVITVGTGLDYLFRAARIRRDWQAGAAAR